MKRLLIVLVSLATTYVVAEAPPCLVDFQEKVSEDSLKKILEMRPKAVKHCLICGTNSCKLKTWSEVNEANDKVCKRLFCKPIKTNRNVYASSENLNLEDLGGICFNSDIYSIKHENLKTRIYKT